MTDEVQMATVLASYRVITILVGLVFGIMGFVLFLRGIYAKSGDLEVAWRDNMKLVMRKGAPGTFFALFGTAIIAISLFVGISFSTEKISPAAGSGADSPAALTEKVTVSNRAKDLIEKFLADGELDQEGRQELATSVGYQGQVVERFQVYGIQKLEQERAYVQLMIDESTNQMIARLAEGESLSDANHKIASKWLIDQVLMSPSILEDQQGVILKKVIDKESLEPYEKAAFKSWYAKLNLIIQIPEAPFADE